MAWGLNDTSARNARARRTSDGRCIRCGLVLDPAETFKSCERCRKSIRERLQKQRDALPSRRVVETSPHRTIIADGQEFYVVWDGTKGSI